MSKYANTEIPRLWTMGQKAHSHTGNFWTDGIKIYSYNLCIGDTIENGHKVAFEYRSGTEYGFKSQTTSCHVGRVCSAADLIADGKTIRNVRG